MAIKMPPNARRLARIPIAAEYADCSTKTIRRRIADGSLTGYRLGQRLIRVDLNEVDAMLRPIPTVTGGHGMGPPGTARNQQGAQASAGWEPNRETRT